VDYFDDLINKPILINESKALLNNFFNYLKNYLSMYNLLGFNLPQLPQYLFYDYESSLSNLISSIELDDDESNKYNKVDKNLDIDLINACKNDSIEDVKILIKKGSNVNIVNDYGDTPLTIACENKNFEIIKYLVEKEAKINISKSTGNSPLNILCKIKNDNSLCTIDYIDYLIKNGADINYKDENSMTLLFTACYFNNLSMLKHLIESNKADINIKNNNNDSLLIVSGYFNNIHIAKYLIKNKADLFLKNKNGIYKLLSEI